MSLWIVTVIILTALFLLVTEKIPVDLTAMGIMVALMVFGILPPRQAVAGFANPAVITVAAMFLISRAMIRTGAVGFVGEKVIQFSRGNQRLAMLMTLVIVALASAFINNTPVVVLFIPIVTSLSCEYQLSPSKFLIPVSYASILAGTCTLIGTSTNIIVSDLSAMYGYGELSMFELSSLGVPIALLGIAFLYFAAPRLMPAQAIPTCELHDSEQRRYLAELTVPVNSPLIGRDPSRAFSEKYPSFEVFECIRKSQIFHAGRQEVTIAANDLLLVKASANDLITALDHKVVQLPPSHYDLASSTDFKDAVIVELIITPQSTLLGEKLVQTKLRGDPGIRIIAVRSRGHHYAAQKIHDVRLRLGDILLLQCQENRLAHLRSDPDFIVVEDVHHEIVHKGKARWAMLIFLAVVMAATSGIADIMVCALAGVFLMVLTGCLQLRDSYRALQGNILVLIAGTIALGTAMEKTGAARLYAETYLSLFHGADPRVILAGIILLASISTQALSNNATAVLLIPIAISTALALGVSPRPFIIAVCFGASACYATPIGYQTNLLVYGPGGYRFSDYLKLGIPLNLLVLIVGSFFIPLLWSF
ncbi:MAG: SLC13 family permease [Deltaproteobacteria bacterium]|nr:SLC13 family permease [Deltaproteobacteria bacterium]MBW2070637.1 SLC13 family permease [Deltaproteobacteria bacterium]